MSHLAKVAPPPVEVKQLEWRSMKRGKAPDHYTELARKEGYPARSVYKLQEINQKQPVVDRGARVLDVGAAPGSWSLWLSRHLGPQGEVVAVDLAPLSLDSRPPNITEVTGDIYEEQIQRRISAAGPYDAVVSDAAPATSGNRTVDTSRSAGLVEFLIYMLPAWLAPGGSFVAKIFQGGEEQQLLRTLRQQFRTARMFKPKACRKNSFETYLIGTGYRGETA
jgi:23S rRNA (uridine2552-2'-O)-methyltransferase